METMRKVGKVAAAVAFAVSGMFVGSANAAWVIVADPDTGDLAFNPGHVSPQDATTVGLYLQDLLGKPTAPTLISQNDSTSVLPTSLPAPLAGMTNYLAIHFGNFNDTAWRAVYPTWPNTGNGNTALNEVFFQCVTACTSITSAQVPSTSGMSNWRLYSYANGGGTGDETVPEPAPIALIGVALAGLALTRRRVKAKQGA